MLPTQVIRAISSYFYSNDNAKDVTAKKKDVYDEAEVEKSNSPLNQMAFRAAEESQFKVFDLTDFDVNENNNFDEDDFCFITFGCQGKKDTTDQQKVADLAARIASGAQKKPKFVIITGDNFYKNGVPSPNSERFKKNFEDIYAEFAKLGIPCFVQLGNHDLNLHKLHHLHTQGVHVGLRQVAHSYYADTAEGIKNKKIFYGQTTADGKVNDNKNVNLDLKQLPLWNMPSRAYSLIYGNTQIFCIDSNTYVMDYITYMQRRKLIETFEVQLKIVKTDSDRKYFQYKIASLRESLKKNQAAFLAEEFEIARSKGKRIILSSHHQPIPLGKRAYQYDLNTYLNKDDIQKVQEYFGEIPPNASYNQLFDFCLKEQKKNNNMSFHATLAAHDHAMYSYHEPNQNPDGTPTCHITSGGGGGGLHNRFYFNDQKNVPFFLKEHGYVEVTCDLKDTENLSYCVRSADEKFELRFNNKSPQPKMSLENISASDVKKIQPLYTSVSSAITKYFDFISARQNEAHGHFLSFLHPQGNVTHTNENINKVHELWAYFSNYKVQDYSTMVEHLKRCMPSNLSDNSFINYLNKAIQEYYPKGTTLDKIINEAELSPLIYQHA